MLFDGLILLGIFLIVVHYVRISGPEDDKADDKRLSAALIQQQGDKKLLAIFQVQKTIILMINGSHIPVGQ